jgi:hypothetical protein
MNKGTIRKLLPHFIAVLIFLAVALIYCRPVLQGQVLQQGDIISWKGMSKSSFDFKDTHGHFPLWTNSMFSGMPAYQIAMEPHVAVSPSWFYGIFSLFLPKPVSFFFLACICFYFLTQVQRINPWIGIIGGLAYAYVTYNTGIIAAGHDTKMNTIALVPGFIGALMLLYEKKYLWGAALTALFTALLVGLNHMQIVYYTLIIAGFMTIGYLVYWIKRKETKHVLIALALAAACGALGVLSNAVTILTTLDASKTTIRGGTELPDQNSSGTGLSKDYALSYSMGKSEPLVMMVPQMFGGSGVPIDQRLDNSKAVDALQSMPQELANQIQGAREAYWGGIGPIPPNAPAYVGAIICFLALLGFFILDDKYKWWMLAACVVAIPMAWGQYFEGFNTFLLNHLPLYNKFRVPSMIMFIPTFLFCLMAIMTLQKILLFENKQALWERYKKGLILTAGIFVIILLVYLSADFTSQPDKELLKQSAEAPTQVKDYIRTFLNALRDDRKSLFISSLVRSFFFIAAAALAIWLYIKNKFSAALAIAVVGVLAFIDIMTVDVKYLNTDNYQDEAEYNQSFFTPTQVDQQIMQDKGYYRVFDLRQGLGTLTQGANTAYYHNSIGGYHPAKLSIYQDLIEHQLYKFPQSMPIVNMLNTKYILQADQAGKESVFLNPDALGAAWFVTAVKFEPTPAAVMNALDNFHPRDTAVVFEKDKALVSYTPQASPGDTITLVKNDNDDITYTSNSAANRFAVFSEIYYNLGWKAYIDGKETPILRTNYVLRGLSVPAGKHEIHFVFHPSSFYTGERISMIAGILMFLLLLAAIVQSLRPKRTIVTTKS